jgi:LPXTG-motif cell wall-anchored protein
MDSLSNLPETVAAAAPVLLIAILLIAACVWFVRSRRKSR